MKYPARFVLLIVMLMLFVPVPSLPAAEENSERKTQRSNFLAAERALNKGKTREYLKLRAALENYPLYPYLEYREIRRNLSRESPERVREFLNSYADTPLAWRLHNAWLNRLARRGDWETYLDFSEPGGSTKRRCTRLQALIKTGQADFAYSQVESLWLKGESQPRECDPVFKAWREAGHLTPDLVWSRIELAMSGRELRLARYLGRFLEPRDRDWLDLWLKVHRNPERQLKAQALSQDHAQRNAIILHGIKRLARRNPVKALNAWEEFRTQYAFTLREQLAAERNLALALVRRNQDADNLAHLERIEPCENDMRLHEARIRAALGHHDWETALAWIEALPAQEQDDSRWRYWRARMLAELGHQAEAEALFETLATERSYYGFMAADRLGSAYNLENDPLQVQGEELDRLLRLEGVQRAYELRALGRMTSARREWQWMLRSLDERQLQVAAKLAQDWDWHDRAILTAARTGYWNDLELRFPLEHRPWIEKQAETRKLDSAWVFAVVRQESAFLSDARSHAGALGLMQLMPDTARRVARSLGKDSPQKTDLLKPTVNIRYGTAYLRTVLDVFGQHPVLATAAYNAGPHRVRAWMPETSMPADIWVEIVPFPETRGYLRRVLAYTIIYEQRLGLQPKPLHERMPPIKGKTLATLGTRSKTSPKS